MTEVEDSFPFARIDPYASEENVVVREYMGQDKVSNFPVYKSREVRLDGLDVNIRTDGAWWNTVRCVGSLPVPLNAVLVGCYKRATVLLPFENRHDITEYRKKFERWQEAH